MTPTPCSIENSRKEQLDIGHNTITDNTGYIIHPDEIIAENVRIMFSAETNDTVVYHKLSHSGKELIVKIRAALKKNED